MYSIEHDKKYLNKYDSIYIYAPIVNGWYDIKEVPDYDLLLIDGPPSTIDGWVRLKFMDHIDLFKLDVPIVIDDVNRKPERMLMEQIAEHAGRFYTVYGDVKKFAVV